MLKGQGQIHLEILKAVVSWRFLKFCRSCNPLKGYPCLLTLNYRFQSTQRYEYSYEAKGDCSSPFRPLLVYAWLDLNFSIKALIFILTLSCKIAAMIRLIIIQRRFLNKDIKFINFWVSIVVLGPSMQKKISPELKLFKFLFSSPEPLGHIYPNLAQSTVGERGFTFAQVPYIHDTRKI